MADWAGDYSLQDVQIAGLFGPDYEALTPNELNSCAKHRFRLGSNEYSFAYHLLPSTSQTQMTMAAVFDFNSSTYASCASLQDNATFDSFMNATADNSWHRNDFGDASSLLTLNLPLAFTGQTAADTLNVTFETQEFSGEVLYR